MTKITVTAERSSKDELTPITEGGAPYVLESAEFDRFVALKRAAAVRMVDELDSEIGRLSVEIEARMVRRADLMHIVSRADAMLAIDKTASRAKPKLVANAGSQDPEISE